MDEDRTAGYGVACAVFGLALLAVAGLGVLFAPSLWLFFRGLTLLGLIGFVVGILLLIAVVL